MWSSLIEKDRILFEDLQKHIHECLEYLDGVRRELFLRDRKLQLIVERLLEIIGEAAGALSDQARAAAPYDWNAVKGMRNILAHQYGAVDPVIVWGVTRNRLPGLLAVVRNALKKR